MKILPTQPHDELDPATSSVAYRRGRGGTFVIGALSLALVVAAPLATAHAQSARSGPIGEPYLYQSTPTVVRAGAVPPARGGGEPTRVDRTFSRPVGDGCTYVAHVAGSVGQAAGAAYSPDVRVDAALDCPDGVTQIRPREVRADAMSAPELARALGDAASVVKYRAGRDCTYAPSFAVAGARVLPRAVNQMCASPAAGASGAAAASVPVDERFARDLDNGCEYRAVVRGAMRAGASGERYAPDLRVRASVHCANVDAVSAPERAVRAASAPADAIGRRIDGAGTVTARQGTERCTYAPRFRVEPTGAVAGQSVTYECRGAGGESVARGGVYVPNAEDLVAQPSPQ